MLPCFCQRARGAPPPRAAAAAAVLTSLVCLRRRALLAGMQTRRQLLRSTSAPPASLSGSRYVSTQRGSSPPASRRSRRDVALRSRGGASNAAGVTSGGRRVEVQERGPHSTGAAGADGCSSETPKAVERATRVSRSRLAASVHQQSLASGVGGAARGRVLGRCSQPYFTGGPRASTVPADVMGQPPGVDHNKWLTAEQRRGARRQRTAAVADNALMSDEPQCVARCHAAAPSVSLARVCARARV